MGSGNTLQAFDPAGTRDWTFGTGHFIGLAPAIGLDGTIYIGSWDNRLYAVNPDGTEKWRKTTGDDVRSAPAVDGKLGRCTSAQTDDKLYALNPSDGSEKWSFNTGGDVESPPSFAQAAPSTSAPGTRSSTPWALGCLLPTCRVCRRGGWRRLHSSCSCSGPACGAVTFEIDGCLRLNPNPSKDTDGRREDSGRGWVRELQGRWPGVLG